MIAYRDGIPFPSPFEIFPGVEIKPTKNHRGEIIGQYFKWTSNGTQWEINICQPAHRDDEVVWFVGRDREEVFHGRPSIEWLLSEWEHMTGSCSSNTRVDVDALCRALGDHIAGNLRAYINHPQIKEVIAEYIAADLIAGETGSFDEGELVGRAAKIINFALRMTAK